MSKKRRRSKKTRLKKEATSHNAEERNGALEEPFRPDQLVALFALRFRGRGGNKLPSDDATKTDARVLAVADLRDRFIFYGGEPISQSISELHSPPQIGEFALEMLLSKEEAENVIGDLAEAFVEKEFKYGSTKAKLWYWRQVLGSAWPLIGKTLRWGFLASAAEWVRRHI